VKSTRTRLSQSQSGEREAVNVAQQTQAELNTMTARTADLQKQLQEVSAKEEDATKKMVAMRYTLGLQKVKTASAKFSLQEAEKKAQDLTAEMEDLKRANEAMAQQLKDAVSHKDMKRVVQAVNTEKESLIGENTRMKDQVKTLKVEVQDTKDRFMAYQAKIRAMTM
jgi:chromosome segregation ATPase